MHRTTNRQSHTLRITQTTTISKHHHLRPRSITHLTHAKHPSSLPV